MPERREFTVLAPQRLGEIREWLDDFHYCGDEDLFRAGEIIEELLDKLKGASCG